MPTLSKREDGVCIVRHFYRDFSTWQLTNEGLSYLTRRGVKEDDHFSTEWFMHLWTNGVCAHPKPCRIGARSSRHRRSRRASGAA